MIRRLVLSSRDDGGQSPAEMMQDPNLYSFVANNPVDWTDLFGLVIVNSGADAAFWQNLLDCWKKTLPPESPLIKIVNDLEASKHKLHIKPLTGKTDPGGKQLENPQTQYNPGSGNSTMYIDPRPHTWRRRPYSPAEAFAHELLHAHDHLENTSFRGRGHGEGFLDDEAPLLREVGKCK